MYNIPPPVVEDDATRRETDKWAATFAVVTILLWSCRWHAQFAGWFSLIMHTLDIASCLAISATVAALAVYCKDRFALFWERQQRTLACIDVIPDLARDVSTLKQDVVDIKKDVKDIKDMIAAKPWYRF